MEKKTYQNPSIRSIKADVETLLNAFSDTPGQTVVNPNTTINKGNAGTAASKHHNSLWDYDADEMEDLEDKEEEKRR